MLKNLSTQFQEKKEEKLSTCDVFNAELPRAEAEKILACTGASHT